MTVITSIVVGIFTKAVNFQPLLKISQWQKRRSLDALDGTNALKARGTSSLSSISVATVSGATAVLMYWTLADCVMPDSVSVASMGSSVYMLDNSSVQAFEIL